MEAAAKQKLTTVWIVFTDPYENIVEGVFDSEDKAERFRLKRLKDYGYPKTGILGVSYCSKRIFEVR